MKFKTAAFIAVATLGLSVGLSGTANAAVGISFDIGSVAMGYSDGYYDNDHHWHRWRHHADLEQYRSAHADNYHEWRHNDRHHHD